MRTNAILGLAICAALVACGPVCADPVNQSMLDAGAFVQMVSQQMAAHFDAQIRERQDERAKLVQKRATATPDAQGAIDAQIEALDREIDELEARRDAEAGNQAG